MHRAGTATSGGVRCGVLALAAVVLLASCAEGDIRADPPPATTRAAPAGEVPPGRDVVVTHITDGDTLRAGEERVRLIGVDTPEVSGGVECYGREATTALGELVPVGTTIRLVADVEATDRYGRTLSYVYRMPDGAFVNLALARDGYAQPLTIPPNVAHEGDFAAAAAEARDASRGLWSACEDDLAPSSSTAPAAGSPSGAGAGDGCEPAYPDVCLPPSPPDLGCGDIDERDFVVLAPDPHRFDGGGDGRGCER